MKSQVKLQKTDEGTYLEANKQETRFCVTYLQAVVLMPKAQHEK